MASTGIMEDFLAFDLNGGFVNSKKKWRFNPLWPAYFSEPEAMGDVFRSPPPPPPEKHGSATLLHTNEVFRAETSEPIRAEYFNFRILDVSLY